MAAIWQLLGRSLLLLCVSVVPLTSPLAHLAPSGVAGAVSSAPRPAPAVPAVAPRAVTAPTAAAALRRARTAARIRAASRPAAPRSGASRAGRTLPGTRWYFAAQAPGGASGHLAFHQLLYVLNPNAVPAPVTFTYTRWHSSTPVVVRVTVPAHATWAETVGADAGPDPRVAVVVASPHVISVSRVVRRVLPDGRVLNANLTPGVPAPARRWSFAEGYIGFTYHEFLSLFNPGASPARVAVRAAFEGTSGRRPAPLLLTVPAHGQAILDVRRAYPHPPANAKSLGLLLASTQPVVALRTLYWGGGSVGAQFGADAKPGILAPSAAWSFTGASVAGEDQPFVSIVAPAHDARVVVRAYGRDGTLVTTIPLAIAAGRRATVRLFAHLRGVAGPLQVAVQADRPVVAELPQYNAGSPNLARHAGDVITGVTRGTSYAHLPYLSTGTRAVAALLDVSNTGTRPLHVLVVGMTRTGHRAHARLLVGAGQTVQYDVAHLGLPRGAMGATLTSADGTFVAFAQGYAGAAEFLSEPAIPLPREAQQAVIVVPLAPTATATAVPAAQATATPMPVLTTFTNATATNTPPPPVAPSATATAPTNTSTATATVSPTATATPTTTPSATTSIPAGTTPPTATPSVTATPTATPSVTATPSATVTFSPTDAPSPTATPSPTSAPSRTSTATATSALSPTATLGATGSPTATMTPASTVSATTTSSPTVTVTLTSTSTATNTPTSTATSTSTTTPTSTTTSTPISTATSTSTSTPTNTPTATPTPRFQTHGINVSVGYADTARGNPDLPVPWKGSPHTVFIGDNGAYDSGAIKLDNTTSSPISVTGVTVIFPNHNLYNGNLPFNLWGSFEIPANSSAILAETNGANFDVSDYGISGISCGNMAGPDNNPPQIMLKTSDAVTTTLLDTGHVLDTGGLDSVGCPRGNESLQWRAIGTGGATVSGGNLTLEPLSSTVGAGATTTLVARLKDAAGVLPLFNAPVDFNVTSGPNAGQTGHVLTDADGVATFSYSSTVTGTDAVVASVTNINNGTFYSNPAAVVWTTPPPASAGSLTLDPTGLVTTIVNQPHSFTVTALDGSGNALSNLAVTVAITGANATTLTATTDTQGQATVAYTGTITGLDAVQALATTGSGAALFSGAATVRWTLPPGSLAINAGGGVAGDFTADTDYAGGGYTFPPSTNAIDTSGVATDNRAPQAVYQSARYGDFTYRIPRLTPDGTYRVRLHFAEAFGQGPGGRVFNVAIDGAPVLQNFDVAATAGGQNKAVVEEVIARADGAGAITIQTTSLRNVALINGIEIIPLTAPSPTLALSPSGPLTDTINSVQHVTATLRDATGAPASNTAITLTVSGPNPRLITRTTDAQGQAAFAYIGTVTGQDLVGALATLGGATVVAGVPVYWQLPAGDLAIDAGGPAVADFVADADASGGSASSFAQPVDTSGVTDPAPQTVYQSYRYAYDGFSYSVPHLTPGAPYTLRLHFADDTSGNPFNVSVNGTRVLSNFDISTVAGGPYRAVVEQAIVQADVSGTVAIAFTAVTRYALVSGIELIPVTKPVPSLVLSPSGPLTATINMAQALTATLHDGSGQPLANAPVTLTVSGPNAGSVSATTNALGQAAFAYTGTVTGADTVGAFAATSGTVVAATTSVTVYWQLPAGDFAINAGGPAVSDFAADTYFSGGGTTGDGNAIDTSGVADPAPQAVYQSFRYDYTGFGYHLPGLTPGASYTLRLHFAERDRNGPGQRLFDVAVNGAPLLRHFDIFAAAGGQNRAVIAQAVVQADISGTLTIAVSAIRDYAQLNGLETLPVSGTAPTLALSPSGPLTATVNAAQAFTATLRDGSGHPLANTPITLTVNGANNQVITGTTDAGGQANLVYTGTVTGADNVGASAKVNGATYLSAGTAVYWQLPAGDLAIDAGGPAAGDFVADTDASGGSATSRGDVVDTSSVTDPAPQAVYQTERYGNFAYTIPHLTPGASYRVRLHFAELFDNGPGQRLFNVLLNGARVLTDFDIFATAGGMDRALVEEFTTTADSNGQITVQYTTLRDAATSSGLEVLPVTPAPTLALTPTGALTNTIETAQVFTATLLDAIGQPLAHTPVTLTISGPNARTLVVTTTTAGLASFVYTGTVTGLDSVGAYAVVSGTTVVADGAMVYWQLPAGDVAINAGGGPAGDFVTDSNVVGGGQSGDGNAIDTSGVADPAPQAVYQSFRYAYNGSFSYIVPGLVPGAAYTVRLHFAERDRNGPGQRLFGVAINATQVLTGFDVFAAAEGQNRAVVEQFAAQADVSGTIGVTVTTQSNDYAFLNGLEIIPLPASSPSLILSPSGTANDTIYHEQAITATARDGAGQPLAGVPVALTIRGPNAPNDRVLHGVTDSQGRARFTYTGTSSGTDMVHATTEYLPAVGAYLTSDPLTVRWVQMPGYVAINAGGPQVSDFVADTDSSGGGQSGGYCCTIDTSGATNPAPQGVYQSFRYSGGSFSYAIPNLAPNAPYLVRLHFAERDYNHAGGRLFNVAVNDIPVLTNFDIYAAAGGQNRAVVEQLAQPADASGAMTITVSAVRDYAQLNGLELIPLASLPGSAVTLSPGGPLTDTINAVQSFTATARDATGAPLANTPLTLTVSGANPQMLSAATDGQGQASFSYVGRTTGTDVVYAAPDVANSYLVTPVRVYWQLPPGDIAINAGGPAVADFVADTDANGGGQAGGYSGPVDTSGAANPAPPQVYQTFRYGNFSYIVPDLTPGAYTVRLHFADRDHSDVGGRLMDVSINGTRVLNSFDVTAAAGGRNRAVAVTARWSSSSPRRWTTARR